MGLVMKGFIKVPRGHALSVHASRAWRLALAATLALTLTGPAGAATSAPTSAAQYVKIDQGGVAGHSRTIVLGLNKAAVVELPVAARDEIGRAAWRERVGKDG